MILDIGSASRRLSSGIIGGVCAGVALLAVVAVIVLKKLKNRSVFCLVKYQLFSALHATDWSLSLGLLAPCYPCSPRTSWKLPWETPMCVSPVYIAQYLGGKLRCKADEGLSK